MSTDRIEANKAAVERLFAAFNARDADAFDELIVEDYVQHDPNAPDGLAGLKEAFLEQEQMEVEIHRVIAEGDLVVVHSHYKSHNMAGVDILRFNDEGKIIEHWDVVQEIPDAVRNDNGMFAQLT